jgi:hypothetical protein
MCPACMSSAALVAGGVMSTGGIMAFAVRVFRSKAEGRDDESKNPTERRKGNGYSNEPDGAGDGRVAR